jgi:glutamyl-tRNA synthetase
VVDDVEMAITDVIRGDDHISNTPKHVLLYQAFGAPLPRFAHVPLILGTDKKRLSKRHGATSVMEYAHAGYLPECMVNFLSLLGWGPGNDEELLTVDELIARFDLEGISGGNAVFNPEKLDWMNNQYIMRVTDDRLIELAKPLLEDAGLWRTAFADADGAWLRQALVLLRPRARRLHDIVDGIRPFVTNVVYDPTAVSKHLTSATMPLLETLRDRLTSVQPFDTASIEQAVRALADEHGIKASALMQAARVALTGRTVSPGLFDVFVLLGRDEACRRLQAAAALTPAGH